MTRRQKTKALAAIKEAGRIPKQIAENKKIADALREKGQYYFFQYNAAYFPLAWSIVTGVLFIILCGIAVYFYSITKRVPTDTERIAVHGILAVSLVMTLFFIGEKATYWLRKKICRARGRRLANKYNIKCDKVKAKNQRLADRLQEIYTTLHIPKHHQDPIEMHSLHILLSVDHYHYQDYTPSGWIDHHYKTLDEYRAKKREQKPSYPSTPLYGNNIKESTVWSDFRTGEPLYRTYDGKIVNAGGEEVSVAWWE